MTERFSSPLADHLQGFLRFKRSLGYRYARGGFTLREFDRFLVRHVKENRAWRLDQAILVWLASKPQRKAVSVSGDVAVLRGLCTYLQRLRRAKVQVPRWPQLPTETKFAPYFLSQSDVRRLLDLAAHLEQPSFRAVLYRILLLLLYCTGIRFGEALRLRLRDVDTRSGILFVEQFKGRARWVPFHRSLSREMDKYLKARRRFASALPDDYFLIGANGRNLPVSTAWETLRNLFRKAGMKPHPGRVGPRPYDLRHAFAIHRLTLWYREGVDLHARLPWLSAYMGHDDILGTQTYLSATPELLGLAGKRFRFRFLSTRAGRNPRS